MRFEDPISGVALQLDAANEVPAVAGVYLWRRVLQFDGSRFPAATDIRAWLKRESERPIAQFESLEVAADRRAGHLGVRSKFILIRNVEVAAGEMRTPFRDVSDIPRLYELVGLVADATARFGPVLYVGESSNLRDRIKEHLAGTTGFSDRLCELGLSFDDVQLSYMETPGLDPGCRGEIEAVLTHLLGAPLTRKAGR